MINVVQNNDVYEISFRYDPNVIYHVKNVAGRRWLPDRKLWTIPKDKLGFLINEFQGTVYEGTLRIISDEDIGINDSIDVTDVIPNIDVSNMKFHTKEGTELYKHQIDFMKFAIDRQNKGNLSGFLVSDDQGLGKTIEALNLAILNRTTYGYKHCLVLCCINSSKFNWQKEIEEHTRGEYTGYILGTRKKRDGSYRFDTGGKEKYDDLVSNKMYNDENGQDLPYFLIVNIESLRYKQGKSNVLADKLINMINSGDLNMIIIDEIHKNASPTSKQGKQLLRIKKNTLRSAMWLPMTGTPITNKPTDVFLPLRLVDAHSYKSYYTWCQEFCVYGGFGGYEIISYKNIPKLKSILQNNMIRRLKSDVLDLPPKLQYTEYVENTPYQRRLYTKIQEDIKNNRDEIMLSLNPLSKLLKLRQVNGNPELVDEELKVDASYISKNAKLQRLLELLEEIHDRGEKVIIFSNWVESLRTLYKFVSKKYKVCCYTGTMKAADREKHKHCFLTNPSYTVMVGTIGALGTSHTLTVAKNIIFYDEPWTPSDKEQAEDRIYRIGTNDSVNIYTLLTKQTVDEKVNNILYTKKNISNFIVDNKLEMDKGGKLFDFLLE